MEEIKINLEDFEKDINQTMELMERFIKFQKDVKRIKITKMINLICYISAIIIITIVLMIGVSNFLERTILQFIILIGCGYLYVNINRKLFIEHLELCKKAEKYLNNLKKLGV